MPERTLDKQAPYELDGDVYVRTSYNTHLAVSVIIVHQTQPCHQSEEEFCDTQTCCFLHPQMFVFESMV